jgi:hypothetical protein
VSILLTAQPFFVNGIEDYDVAKNNALGACGCFAVTLIYSLYKIYNPSEKLEEYEGQGMEGYQLNTGVSSYGSH